MYDATAALLDSPLYYTACIFQMHVFQSTINSFLGGTGSVTASYKECVFVHCALTKQPSPKAPFQMVKHGEVHDLFSRALEARNTQLTVKNSQSKGNSGLFHHGHKRLTTVSKQSLFNLSCFR